MESRGRVNCYSTYKPLVGSLHRNFFTVNLANGVTPFMKVFGGVECASSCYRLLGGTSEILVEFAWYRPSREEFEKLDDGVQDHVLNGGLLCDTLEVAVSRQMRDDVVEVATDYERFQAFCLERYGKRRGPLES